MLPSGHEQQKRERGRNGSTTVGLGSSQGGEECDNNSGLPLRVQAWSLGTIAIPEEDVRRHPT